MEGFKPAHKLGLTKSKGGYKAYCSCGWSQVGKSKTSEESVERYHRHTGVIEKTGRR